MRTPFSTVDLARQPFAYAPSDFGASNWYLLPVDARTIFRCRLTGRYATELSLNAVCGNGYAAVHQLAESHVDTISRLLVRDAQNDAKHRIHAFDDGIDWQ
ncbi:hypothetical protein KDW65_31760 [Burkholderia cenocepacia]|uniref:hypothetical protein n=1 Tax=Burkholderia cenocepacia TaxID=95486 RepID=UPI001B9B2706|nr:hypothetical protein [Burkholderia cenocepacia]MBR8401208.1 hypothetical protein [Burkholderia cenocepacia]